MKVLQLCIKPPFPTVDGGTMAMNSITHGLLREGCEVKVLAMESDKHPADRAKMGEEYLGQTGFESQYVDLSVKPLAAAAAMLCGESYHVSRFRSEAFAARLRAILERETFDVVHLESLFMTPYVLDDAQAAQEEALRRKRVLSDPRPWDDRGWSRSPIADPVSKKEQLRRQALEWANQDAEHETGKKLEEAKEQRVKDLEEKADKERREWAEKHAKDVLEALKRQEGRSVDWSELIDKLRREQEGKDAAKAQEEQSAAKIRESTGEPAAAPAPTPAPAPAPAPVPPKTPEGSAQPPAPAPASENVLGDLRKK